MVEENSKEKSGLAYMTDVHISVQKLRVATGNRVAHLAKRDAEDSRAAHIHAMATDMENIVEKYIAEAYKTHPAYPWLSRIRGCGEEIAAKVVGLIEGVTFASTGRSGIEAFDTMSKLRRFAGLAPIDGKAEKVKAGQKGIHYNPELRMMLWRLLTSLMKQVSYRCNNCETKLVKADEVCGKCGSKDIKTETGIWYRKYLENDDFYMRRCEKDGITVIPTPSERLCPECRAEKKVPTTTRNCPDCNTKLEGKKEPDGIMFRGHVVNMAKRKTIRLWLDMLYVVWRQAEKLPIRSPYIEQYGGHEIVDPWSMVDK